MDSLTTAAYNVLVSHWGVDGEHDLTYVADALLQGDRETIADWPDRLEA